MSYYFDGVDDRMHVSLGSGYLLEKVNERMTLAVWHKSTALGSATNTILSKTVSDIGTTTDFSVRFTTGSQAHSFSQRVGETTSYTTHTTSGWPGPDFLNEWILRIVTFDMGVERRAYNATPQEVYTDVSNAEILQRRMDPNSIGPLVVGTVHMLSSVFYTGRVAEIALWKRALLPAQFEQLRFGIPPTSIFPEDLFEYWPLVDNLNGVVRGLNFTNLGATVNATDHPPIQGGIAPPSNLQVVPEGSGLRSNWDFDGDAVLLRRQRWQGQGNP